VNVQIRGTNSSPSPGTRGVYVALASASLSKILIICQLTMWSGQSLLYAEAFDFLLKKKGKVFPLQAHCGPEGG